MAKRHFLVLLLAAGFCILIGGLLYGVLTVGVPIPDGRPSLAARESRDASTAGVVMEMGAVVSALGALVLAIVAIARAVRLRASESQPQPYD